MAFLTSTIGSFPKPPALHEARRRFADGEIDGTALREIENEAVSRVIAIQEDLGLHLLVDGEMDRADPICSFAERLGGIDIAGWVRVFGDRYVRKPKIVGPVTRAGSSAVDRWRFSNDAASAAVKAVIPGPYSLMDGSFDEHYGSRRDACLAFAEVVRAEALDLAAAGATEIQLDEPSAGARIDEIPLLIETVGYVTGPLAGRARTWVYLGYADLAAAGAGLATIPADGILVAGAHCAYAGLDAFAQALPEERFAGIGVVDVLDPRVETEAEIAARIARVGTSIPKDRLWVVPDGGFRAVRAAAARGKLAAMVAAAR